MAGMGSFRVEGMKELQKELEKLEREKTRFCESCIKELAARLLAAVVLRTPVSESGVLEVVKGPSGKITKYKKGSKKGQVKMKRLRPGGVLRRGWISKTQEEAEGKKGSVTHNEIQAYLNGVQVERSGTQYKISIINPVEYALIEWGM